MTARRKKPERRPPTTLRSRLLALLVAGSCAAAGPAAGQAPDSAFVDQEPLFTTADAWIAGGFLLAAAALAPLDQELAEAARDGDLQQNDLIEGASETFRFLGHPGALAVGGGFYLAGRLADRPVLADLGLHATESILLGLTITGATKILAGRARPSVDPDDPHDFELGRGFRGDDYQAFPSGHSTAAFATAAALATEISRAYPRRATLAGVLLYGGAGLVALSRMYHDEHWASDVVVGAAIGGFSGWKVVRYAHTRPRSPLDRWLLALTPLPTGDGGVLLAFRIPL